MPVDSTPLTLPTQSSKRPRRLLKWIMLCLVAGALGWFGLHRWQTTRHTQQAVDQQLQERLQSQQAILQTQKDQLDQLQHHYEDLQRSQQQQLRQLTAQAEALTRVTNDQKPFTVILADIQSQLLLADRKLALTYDAKSVFKLLSALKQQLVEQDQVRFASLIRSVEQDLQSLMELQHLDMAALTQQFATLYPALDQLSPRMLASTIEPAPPAATPQTGWRASVKQAWQQLHSQWFVVRHYQEEVHLGLSANEVALTRGLLKLNLQQAELALLRYEPSVFHDKLRQIRATVAQVFREQDSHTQAFLSTLAQLDALALPAIPVLQAPTTFRQHQLTWLTDGVEEP